MMEIHHRWYEDTAGVIKPYQDTLPKKEQKKYKLDLLLRVARKVADFSDECGNCQLFQPDITTLAQELGTLVQMPDKARRKHHLKTIDRIVKHLQDQHKMVTQGHHVGLWIAIGSGIGVALGAGIGSVGGGIPIGVAVGVAIGLALDARAKKEGRVI